MPFAQSALSAYRRYQNISAFVSIVIKLPRPQDARRRAPVGLILPKEPTLRRAGKGRAALTRIGAKAILLRMHNSYYVNSSS